MIVGCALRGLFLWYKEKWIITQSGHYPFYNFLLKVTSTITYHLLNDVL